VTGSIFSGQIGGDYAALSVGSDGTLYFSNYANDTVYAATVGGGAAPQAGQFSLMRTAAEPSQSSLMAAAAVNSAPSVSPVVRVPDQSTGAVSVSLNAVDAEGNPLTYAVTGQPASGSLRVDGAGVYTYTPTAVARLAAGSTSAPDFDGFTITVSDGQGGVTPVAVSVPVLPSVLANKTAGTTGASPYGVAMVGNIAYVANQGTNTVTVLDTSNPDSPVVVRTLTVGSAPTGVVAVKRPDGTMRVYVTNRTSGTVSVINPVTNTVIDVNTATTTIDSIKVGSQPEGVTANADGSLLYVANYGSGTVSVIDTATNKLVDANTATTTIDSIKVGSNPRGSRLCRLRLGGGCMWSTGPVARSR
jgi:YVTN family beta-propeller protein/VCBS repeat-containing protein